MAFHHQLNEFNRSISEKLQWLGIIAILVMMMVTTIDVFMAKTFLQPIRGSIDIVELAQLVAISFAAAMTLLQGRHVEVEFVVMVLPKRVQYFIAMIIQLLCLGLFVLMVWRLIRHGYYLQIGREVSFTARIPIFPFVYGAALGIIPLCLIYIGKFIESITKVFWGWNP